MNRDARDARVARAIQQVLADRLARGRVHGVPEGVLVSITEVRVTPDHRHARVWVSVYGDPDAGRAALVALRKAAAWLRREAGAVLRTRALPELLFEPDEALARGARVDALLRGEEPEEA